MSTTPPILTGQRRGLTLTLTLDDGVTVDAARYVFGDAVDVTLAGAEVTWDAVESQLHVDVDLDGVEPGSHREEAWVSLSSGGSQPVWVATVHVDASPIAGDV